MWKAALLLLKFEGTVLRTILPSPVGGERVERDRSLRARYTYETTRRRVSPRKRERYERGDLSAVPEKVGRRDGFFFFFFRLFQGCSLPRPSVSLFAARDRSTSRGRCARDVDNPFNNGVLFLSLSLSSEL